MKSSYRAIVIGGGVVGASVLYHLAKFGWTDVALIERSELTAGSTWHAAAGFHALNGDPNVAALQAYTIDLYRELEKESGQSVGLHMTGGINIATNAARWEQLKAGHATFQAMGVETSRLVNRDEILEMTCDVIRTDDIVGGLYDSNEGYLDPYGATHAYAGAAKKRGADVILRNRVIELNQKPGGWEVVTENGTIFAEHVVNAGGLWAKQCGRMVGVDLPVTPMEHHYLVTEKVPGLAKLPGELPIVVDLEGYTYTRQERDGLLLGVYERNPKHWNMDGAPWDYGIELIPEDIDRIGEELGIGFERFPELAEIGIRKWVNGAFTFSPDGNPLVGPIGPPGYWVACGVMAGFSQGGGVGKSLAEWMINGAPEADIFGMDVARFGDHQSNKEYIRQTTAQFYARRMVMTYPNEQLPAGRPLKTPGAFAEMSRANCRWGTVWGLEVPLYFAPGESFKETGTLRRSEAFEVIGSECAAVENGVGLLDISGFSRFRISGKQARKWLDKLLACKLPGDNRVKLAPMLGNDGRLKGDLTCFNWGEDEFWLMGSYYLRKFHKRWFDLQAPDGVIIEDISDSYAGFALHGPKSRELLQELTDTDLEPLKMMQCQEVDLGLHRTRLARLSLSGELAYEINCPISEHAGLRRALLRAGLEYDLHEVGFNAMLSMRLEKSIGIWNAEFTQNSTPSMTGLDRWIAWDKGDFIGRDAALQSSDPERKLTMIEVDATDADCSGFEPVRHGDKLVGITTSGGYGHRLGRSFAMAMVDKKYRKPGVKLTVDVVGETRPARVIEMSPYDTDGTRMRT